MGGKKERQKNNKTDKDFLDSQINFKPTYDNVEIVGK